MSPDEELAITDEFAEQYLDYLKKKKELRESFSKSNKSLDNEFYKCQSKASEHIDISSIKRAIQDMIAQQKKNRKIEQAAEAEMRQVMINYINKENP